MNEYTVRVPQERGMKKPTGKLAFAYDTIRNHEATIQSQQEEIHRFRNLLRTIDGADAIRWTSLNLDTKMALGELLSTQTEKEQ